MAKKFSERFSFKISTILILILFFSLLLNSFLNFFNFEKTYKDLVCSRFIVAGKDLRNTIEFQLNLGLNLRELKIIQGLIDEIKTKDKSITSIKVFDDKGVILFDTAPEKIMMQVDKNILSEANKYINIKMKNPGEEKPVTMMDKGNGIIILPLINNYGIRVGSIALSYPEDIVRKPVNRILKYLLIVFTVSLLIFSVITFIAVYIISRNLSGGFTGMKNSLEEIINEGKSTYSPPGNNARMEEVFIQFQDSALKALDEINRADSEIDSIKKENTYGN